MFEYNPYRRRSFAEPRRVQVWPPRPAPTRPAVAEPEVEEGQPPVGDRFVDQVTPMSPPSSNEASPLFSPAAPPAFTTALQRENSELRQALEKAQAEAVQQQEALRQVRAEQAALQARLKAAGDPWQERFLALQTELGDLRARWQRRFADEAEHEKQRLLRSFLPFADHLQWAVQHGDSSEVALQTMLKDFVHTLAMEGVTPVEAAGRPFDPTEHEAVSVTAADGVEPGMVVDVVSPGYRYKDALLRPARVRVSQ
ncbi:nucleotide exchange factor GrpE [Candidatus Amarolinea aalborgensis]|uniref:nucleotide exchange factor GrpE n=1 Tax=Candidatus Amarolinea aalborgensis TaxID=2249329 RepID=UPI003BF972D1